MKCLIWVLASAFAVMAEANGAPDPAAGNLWNAPDRGEKVAALIPGRRIPTLTPETLFAEWTQQQIERWNRSHPPLSPEEAYRKYAATAPTDAELTADFPVHISPYGRVRSGKPEPAKAAAVMLTYCPFCQSQMMSLKFDPANPYHATTTCCKTELYGRPRDYPAGYTLRATGTVRFRHLDDTWQEAPVTIYRDKDGVVWELFIKTIFDYKRWRDKGCDLVWEYGNRFRETADPLYAHKIAVILDKVADTYYGLPLSFDNELCNGKDGKPLTRAEWEAVPRPAIFELSYLGSWNRRVPDNAKGWLNMSSHEHIWVEPFALVRHHPAFQYYSQIRYGDPSALDRKIMTKLMRELSLMFQSVFAQRLLHNYQEANYFEMWLLGVLLHDRVLLDFAAPTMELTMYNHTYQDGLNGEGAPNYMDMPGSCYYPFLKDPKGWLEFEPRFLEENPFYWAASGEMGKLRTVRGLQLEWGDQHEQAFTGAFLADPAQVGALENEVGAGSRNWAGYGVGVIRVGGPGHRQEVALDYTRAFTHIAQDALSMECWVDGVPVMRKGGYSSSQYYVPLEWDRSEFKGLRGMDYPHEMVACKRSGDDWSRAWSHSPLCQNGVTVDHVGTGKGWADNRGYGEVITFKGGESPGEPGAGFQVLDARDQYSWARVHKDVADFRRTLIGVEGPDGRPYVLDMLRLSGGHEHTLYNSAWAERAESNLPAVKAEAKDLVQCFFAGKLPGNNEDAPPLAQLRRIERLAAAGGVWDLTWKTDYAAYAERDVDGKAFRRPLPEDVGRVRLRMVGISQPDGATELLRGKGPWTAWVRQPLPLGQAVNGNVAFLDARDFLVEHRTASPDPKTALDSFFVHILEGYREGETSAISSVTPLKLTDLKGAARQTIALELKMAAGHTDTVIYQSDAGTVRLPDGTETDARYALVRRDAAGEVIEADVCRGTRLESGKFVASLPGDFTGTIVDIIGDLTGTRQESALVIKPDKPWPEEANLKDRQLLIRVTSPLRAPCNEGYRIEKVTPLADGLARVDLQDHAPFAVSWHEVAVLPGGRPNVLRTNRPMSDHGDSPWYNGLKVWFPERAKVYTIKHVNEVGGGWGGDTLELAENVNLTADGIRVGDWYVIYGVEPGLQVAVANDFCWRREPGGGERQHALRATGVVTVKTPDAAAK